LPATICFSSLKGFTRFLVLVNLVDVGSLSSRITFKPVSSSLQRSLHFFHLSSTLKTIKLSYDRPLFGVTSIQALRGSHVPLVKQKCDLGSIYTPVALNLRVGCFQPNNPPHTFWFKPISAFGLLDITVLTIVRLIYPYHTP